MRRPGWAAVAVSSALLLAAGCGAAADPSDRPAPARPAVSAPASSPPAQVDTSVPGPGSAAVAATPRARRPVRITAPAIGLDASMTELGVAEDGSIEVPSHADQVGWLDTTPSPGQQGPAVLAGHVDSDTGPAVFYRLGELTAGDEVVVTLRDGTAARFTVDGVRDYPQDRFPTAEVYGPVPGPALRLITCGGDYLEDHGGYQDNVVVYAS